MKVRFLRVLERIVRSTSAHAISLLDFLHLAPIAAQAPVIRQVLDSGTLVRLHMAGDSIVRGRLIAPLAPGAATLFYCRYPGPPCRVADDPGARQMPASSIQRIDVARSSGARTGGIIGAVIGLLIGTSLGQVCFDGPCPSAGHAALHAGLPVAAVFALLGATIGSGLIHWGTAR